MYPNELPVPEQKEETHSSSSGSSVTGDWWLYVVIGAVAVIALAFGVRRWAPVNTAKFRYKPVEKPAKGELLHDQDELEDSEDELEEV